MSVASDHSKRNYAKALDEIFALCELRHQPLSRALLMEYRAMMLEKNLSASTINVRLSADRGGATQRNQTNTSVRIYFSIRDDAGSTPVTRPSQNVTEIGTLPPG
jgi:hypothetical protein